MTLPSADYEFDDDGHCPALPKHQPHEWRHLATAGSVSYRCSGEEPVWLTTDRAGAARTSN